MAADWNDNIKLGISMMQERYIGRMMVSWALLEAAMQDLIWHLLKIPMSDGRIMTQRMNAEIKIKWLHSFAKKHLEPEQLTVMKEILAVIEDTQDDRNFVMHGIWGTDAATSEPIACSLRKKSLPDEVTYEHFPVSRMRKIIADIEGAKAALMAWRRQLGPLPDKSPESHSAYS
jgi:hypothetical protein